MSLGFLYPLAWLGALAVALPIWLHLHRRSETSLVRFSALQFLDDQPLARKRPLWPRDWPLLLLRVLALILLAAAFAWPYLPHAAAENEPQEACVYILDNTLSNQAAGAFAKARDDLVREISSAGPDRQIALVELTGTPRVLAGFSQDRSEAVQRLRALQGSFQRGSYLAAFRTANSLLRQSPLAKKRIVLAGDSQENQWSETGQVLPFLQGIEVTLPKFIPHPLPNLAIFDARVQRLFVDDLALADCSVRLFHQGDQAAAIVVFRAGGREVARRQVKLTGQPESIAISARWETDPAAWLQGEVRLEGQNDALGADDRVVFALPPVREGRLAILAHSTFLQTALSPDVMKGRWATRVLRASEVEEGHVQADEEVLCLESHFLRSDHARRLLKSYLNSGRGALLVVDVAAPTIAGFLREFGVEAIAEAPAPARDAHFGYVSTDHPLFQPFRSPEFDDLLGVEVKRHRRLKATAATPLAFSAEGDPLVFELPVNQGKLFVLAFSLDRTETNWPIHPTFIPFLDRCLDQARAQPSPRTVFEPGESIAWTPQPGREVKEVGLKPIDGSGGAPFVTAPVVGTCARLSLPDSPGLYALHYDGRPQVEGVLAVNPPPDESRLIYAASDKVVNSWMLKESASEAPFQPAVALLEPLRRDALGQRIWWWLALAGLAALVLETTSLSLRKGGG